MVLSLLPSELELEMKHTKYRVCTAGLGNFPYIIHVYNFMLIIIIFFTR